MDDVVHGNAAKDALTQRGDNLVAVFEGSADQSAQCAAVFFGDDDVVRDVDETAGQVTGVGRLQGGVGQTLAGTVRRDEVFEHRHALLEVRENRVFDDLRTFGSGFLRLGHQTTHTGQLGNLVGRTTGARVKHHEDGVETLVGLGHLLHEGLLQVGVDVCPRIDDLVITLVVGDETHVIVHRDLLNLLVTALDDVYFLFRDDDVVQVERQTALVGHAVAEVLDTVEEFAGTGHADRLDDAGNNVAQGLLRYNRIDKAHFGRHDLIDYDTPDRGLDNTLHLGAVLVDVIDQHLYRSVNLHPVLVECDDSLLWAIEREALALRAGTELGDVIQAEHHVLRRHRDGRAIGRIEDVVALEHKHLRLEDGLVAQRQVDSHLVAVEVGVERRTCQRVELDGLAFDELGLEGLDTETVKRRGTVEKHRVAFHHVFKDVPDDGFATIDNLLGALDRLDDAALYELADDEGLVELSGHQLRQTALAHLQFGTDHDDRTGRIVDTLTQKVLAETSLLAFQ